MAEPSAIWSPRQVVTDKSISLTQNIILSYARDALRSVVSRVDLVHQITKLPDGGNTIISDDLPSILTDITIHQGIASTLLFNDGQRSYRESDE